MGIIDVVSQLWRTRPVGREDPEKSSETGVRGFSPGGVLGRTQTNLDAFYEELLGTATRQNLYQIYGDVEEGVPEINSILDIYADYAVSGGTHDGTRSLKLTSKGEIFDRRLARIDQNIQLSSKAWRMVRSMVQYGDAFYELIVNGAGLQELKVLPRREMYRIEDEYGTLQGYEQRSRYDSEAIEFEPWQVAHFRLRYDDERRYGRSLLWPVKRDALEYMLMKSALTIGRLSRAHRRLKHKIDVGNVPAGTAEQERIIAQAQARNHRQKTMDPRTGKMSLRSNPLRAEEDIFVAVREKSPADVEVVKGDDSIQNIEDVLFKRASILSGAKMPESWLGLTGPNVRNVADHQVINFLKTVRRVQRDFAAVAIVPFQIALMLQGIPWQRVFLGDIDIAFPKMSLVEDMMRLEIDKLRTIVGERLIKTRLMSRSDILMTFFEYSQEKTEELLTNVDADTGAPDLGRSRTPGSTSEGLDRSLRDELLNKVLEAAEKEDDVEHLISNIRFLAEELKRSSDFKGLS